VIGLSEARKRAEEIVEWLRPLCERIEIAGSIRRGKSMVKDIDLVVVPRMQSSETLLGVTDDVAMTDFYAKAKATFGEILAAGTKLIRGIYGAENRVYARYDAMVPYDRDLAVDIYLATPETWATLLLIRTGSAEHNIWMASRAKSCGGKLSADGSGLELAGQYEPIEQRSVNMRVRPENEEQIFKALGLPYAEPRERECANGRPVWMRT